MNNMKTRFRLITRGIRGGKFYCVDKTTGKRTSLNTTTRKDSRRRRWGTTARQSTGRMLNGPWWNSHPWKTTNAKRLRKQQ